MKIKEPYKKLPKTVEATMEWDGAMGFSCRSGSGHEIKSDASIEHGGKDEGTRPMELLLFSLSSCTGMDVATFLRKRKRHLEDIRISAHGRRVADHPHVFETITLEYILTGSDITDDDIYNPQRYGLFDNALWEYFWDYDNHGLKHIQLRFYPVV